MDILKNISARWYPEERYRGLVAAEKEACLVAVNASLEDNRALERYLVGFSLFCEATLHAPLEPDAYRPHAAYLCQIGCPELALRFLRSIEHLSP
jgi:hypothetical protein